MDLNPRTFRTVLGRYMRGAAALLCAGMVASACAEVPGNAGEGATRSRNVTPLLDGSPKSLVVVGYSTSYAWPSMLQEMLDEHSDGERVYHVLNSVIGGSPVGRWIAPTESVDYRETYGAMEQDFFGTDARLRGEAPEPSVAIVQQSLQRTPTPATRLGPVTSAMDDEGIEVGADALERLVMQLGSNGVERVYIGMHIYKEGFEPEVGNERFALSRLLDRGHESVLAGPDVWSLTIAEHPEAFTDDRLHPNERGSKIMAEAWYRSLAGDDARQHIIDALHERAYDVDTMMDDYLAWRRADASTQQ